MLKQVSLACGKRQLSISLKADQIVDCLEGRSVDAVANVEQAVRDAVHNPIGSLPLAELINKDDKVAIIVSDITRQWIGYDLMLPPLLDELNKCGVQDIKLVVALGAHRQHTDEENKVMYGLRVVERVEIVQSHALEREKFVSIGTTSRGTKVCVNAHVVQADKVILTGGITYHSMAGFGGGRKAIMPGVSEYASIQDNHRLCLQPKPGQGLNPHCASGSLDENEMHLDMMEMAELLQPAFLVNAVYTSGGEVAGIFAGNWKEAWLEGCRAVENIYGVPVSGKADVVLVSAGGFPKDINFYQASKAIENAWDAVKVGGVMIAVMECRDIAEPPDFSKWFAYQSVAECESALRQEFTVPGFVALKLGIIARQITMIVVTLPENRDFITQAGMIAAASLEEAMEIAQAKLGREDYRVIVMPQGANTMPVFQSCAG